VKVYEQAIKALAKSEAQPGKTDEQPGDGESQGSENKAGS